MWLKADVNGLVYSTFRPEADFELPFMVTGMYACRRPAALTVMLSYTNLLIHFLVWIRATAFPILPASLFDVFARRTCSCDKFKALALDVAIGQARSLLGHELVRKDDGSSRNGDGDCDLREEPVAVVK